MASFDFHCQIDEDIFSITVFLTRLLAAVSLLYLAIGCLLHYRDFLYNAASLGCPLPVPVGLGLAIGLLFLGLLLILGWFTRWVAGICILFASGTGWLFFAGNFNKIYVALIILLVAALLPATLLGPGKISLDYNHALRRAKKIFRG